MQRRLQVKRLSLVGAVLILSAQTVFAVPGTVNFCGWEGGASGIETSATAGTFSVQSTTKRTGGYALQVNPATTATGYNTFGAVGTNGAGTSLNIASAYTRFYFRVATAPTSGDEPIYSGYVSTTMAFELRLNSSRQLALYSTTPSLLATGTTVLALNTWYRIDLRVDQGATGTYLLKIDGTQEFTGTGNFGTSNFDTVRVGKNVDRTASNGNLDVFYDDFAIGTTDYFGAGGVFALRPAGDGNYTTCTIGAGAGSDWQNVDEVPSDDNTTYLVTTGVATDKCTVSVQSTATAGVTETIDSVKVVVIMMRDGATNGSLKIFFEVNGGGGSTSETTAFSSTTSYGDRAMFFATNPNGAATWVASAVDNIHFGVTENSANKSRWSMGYASVNTWTEAVGAGGSGRGGLLALGVGAQE